MENKLESEDIFKKVIQGKGLYFDLMLGKGFDNFHKAFQDKGIIILISITEWVRIWLNIISTKLPEVYSSELRNFINI